MAKKNKGLGYNLSDYADYETAPFSYDDRISEYMNSKVGNNRKYRLQRISELNNSIAMERNYLPENFTVGGFTTGSTNPNAHVPLGVSTSGWQKGMKNPNLIAQSEIPSGSNLNWTFYKDKATRFAKIKTDTFMKDMGKLSQGIESFTDKGRVTIPVKASMLATTAVVAGVSATVGVAGRFLLDRQEESDTKISKKLNTFG